jgi:hypothetical protein
MKISVEAGKRLENHGEVVEAKRRNDEAFVLVYEGSVTQDAECDQGIGSSQAVEDIFQGCRPDAGAENGGHSRATNFSLDRADACDIHPRGEGGARSPENLVGKIYSSQNRDGDECHA